ncbi:TPA: hypothetical protein ACJ2PE_001936 [Klebsiella pneumoniae]|uniref:Uncharacterized protein n=2 Tax=Klebsiella pneumoniae TaxID=573 RepID=A0A483NGB1_KLEPN|nr:MULTISPECIES: hypothetical protein [Klebsiella]HDS8768121.1 hypothetical protein [Klebsiella pneumoniae subsp. ozaenae]EJD6436297.1 hypothetical protein [Klebsiella pneumoniae]EJD6446164.1 hypothetical protein [Klebsiella pneumoniae]EJD6517639.1 hypothetical protein [Klebsiella pneumoniae]EJD6634206.1 hypothetical protein [Klebsiella pneumoniae]
MKLLTTTLLATSICLSAVFPADAGNIVGSVKAWEYMQADGWKSADGMDDNTLHNMLYQANVIDNYPWTKQFLLRTRGGGAIFLADKKTHTIRQLKLNPVGETYNDIETVYQGEDKGDGCYFAIVDNQSSARQKAIDDLLSYPLVDNVDAKAKQIRQQMTPKVVMVIPDRCVNKQQQAALAAKRSEEDRKLQQWVAQQSLAELCHRTGNC